MHRHARLRHGLKSGARTESGLPHHLIVAAPTQRRSGQVHIGGDLAQERQEFAAPVPDVQRSNVERGVEVEVPLGTMTADVEVSYRLDRTLAPLEGFVNDMLITKLPPIRNRIRELRREKAPRGRWRSR